MKRTILLVTLVTVAAAATRTLRSNALNTLQSGWSLGRTTIKIDAHGDCNVLTNVSSAKYFVPTKSASEWSTFLGHLPMGVTADPCLECGSGQGYWVHLPDGTKRAVCMFPYTFVRQWTSDAPDFLTLSRTADNFCPLAPFLAKTLYCLQVDTSCPDDWNLDPDGWTTTASVACEALDAPEGWEPLEQRNDCST